MTKQAENAPREQRKNEETLTPFLERSITELISLFAQLFTTPFAFLSYNKRFRDQVTALAKDDIETAYPETVARPLSFFVLLMAAHFLLSGIYTSAHGPLASTATKIIELFDELAKKIGNTEAVIAVAFAMILIIAVKAYLISITGYILRCPVRFKTALNASAYAFGTFIFFQYVFLSVRYLAATIFPKVGNVLGLGLFIYGTLALSMLLVVRVNQVIRQTDGTGELATYSTWFVGTVAWHFFVVLCATYLLQSGSLSNYWENYLFFWTTFGRVFYPPGWVSS